MKPSGAVVWALVVLAESCQPGTRHETRTRIVESIPRDTVPSLSPQAVASNQSILCIFVARVTRLAPADGPLPSSEPLAGYLVDAEPRWTLELDVLPHENKIPFQPGVRTAYIADVESVFGVAPEAVEGEYEFSFMWNVDVPGRPEFEAFRARRR